MNDMSCRTVLVLVFISISQHNLSTVTFKFGEIRYANYLKITLMFEFSRSQND